MRLCEYLDTETNRPKQRAITNSLEKARYTGLLRKHCFRKSFVKVELQPMLKRDFDPRVIQATSDFANYLLATWIIPIQSMVKKIWRYPRHNITYSSGLTPTQLGGWMRHVHMKYERVKFLQVDFSRWDASLGPEALWLERKVLKPFVRNDDAMKVYKNQVSKMGFTARGLVYRVNGGRNSGDPNTSLGNSVINSLVHLWYFQNIGVPCDLLVQGDDMVVAFSGRIQLEGYVDAMKSLGLVAEAVVHDSYHKVEFCSGYFWRAIVDGAHFQLGHGTVRSWVFGPMPHRVLGKFGYTFKQPRRSKTAFHNGVKTTEWNLQTLRGQIKGYCPGIEAIPILRDFMRRELGSLIIKETDRPIDNYKYRCMDSKLAKGNWKQITQGITFDPEAIEQFVEIYGFIPSSTLGRNELVVGLCL
jgi:hypothetical protein